MKPVIYQLVVRYFGNTNLTNATNGDIATNGCGKFADINEPALRSLRELGVTDVWLTGVHRQATLTDYAGIGLPADPPDIVKGIAGSSYAIRDYYDVCPDYAGDPANRMAEFEALVGRIHAAGLRVLVDLVGNHVSRAYDSKLGPQPSWGQGDDKTKFFDPQNNFFYLPDSGGLRLSKPSSWKPPGVTFMGVYAPEDGSAGHPAKVSGNNCLDVSPAATDWYETIKLNYGFDFSSRRTVYEPKPATWLAVDHVLAYWQAKGIDGFRCDFAHYVPAEAWRYLIDAARARQPAYFFAEAYPYAGSSDPLHSQDELIAAGFDAVYHYQSYNALKQIYFGQGVAPYDYEMVGLPDALRPHVVNYLENHDERRIASPVVTGGGTGDSGFGSREAGYQLAPLQFLFGPGPVLLFNGQEVGEPGAGAEGFAGDDGRTTIFDYWAMPEHAKWVGAHTYNGAALSDEQRALRHFYADLLKLCQSPSVCGSGYWGLRYFNGPACFGDCPGDLYSFARFEPGSGQMLLIAANFRCGGPMTGRLRLPSDLISRIELPMELSIRLVLDRSGAKPADVANLTRDALEHDGFEVTIANQTTHVYAIGAA